VAPTLTITSDVSALRMGQTAKLTFTFSEAPGSSFDASDIVATQGTVSNLLSTFDPLVYTATFTPAAAFTGNANITVASGAYTDAAGNDGGAGATPAIAIDTAAPTVTITRDSASPALLGEGMTATVHFSFSEAAAGRPTVPSSRRKRASPPVTRSSSSPAPPISTCLAMPVRLAHWQPARSPSIRSHPPWRSPAARPASDRARA
jgi:hypothetical protein